MSGGIPRVSPRRPAGWPTAGQELLLRAALLAGEPAATAWRAWRERVGVDAADWRSRRLFPLVYRNLRALGVDDPSMPRLKDVCRHAWVKNQVLLGGLTATLRALRVAGIPTLVTKGAALVPYYGGNSGLRPMGDCDIVVPTDRAAAAIDVVAAAGWTSTVGGVSPRVLKDWIVPRTHAWEWRRPDGAVLDLHWHVLAACLQPDADVPFWEGSTPLEAGGQATRALNPTDMLLHVCAHGMQREGLRAPGTTWVADAVMILRQAAAAIDAARLAAEADRRRLLLPAREALRYVSDAFDPPGARELLQALRAPRVSLLERLEHRAVTKPPWRRGPAARAIEAFGLFTRRRLPVGVRPGPRAVVRHCQERWELGRPWEIPLHALFLVLGRPWPLRALARRLFRRPRAAARVDGSRRCGLGEPLDFSSAETLARHAGIGWSVPEPTGAWTDGACATLRLDVSPGAAGDLLLRTSLSAFVTEAAPLMEVDVVVNDARLARWRFDAASYRDDDRRLRIPAGVAARYAPMEVALLVRAPRVPAALGLGDDLRALGVHVERMVVDEAEPSALAGDPLRSRRPLASAAPAAPWPT